MRTTHRLSSQAGFTLIELMVACMVLAVGVAGAFTLLDTANKAISSNNGRVAATNLARELSEYARGTDYDLLTPTQAEAALRSRARIAGTGASGAWQIERRGETYSITPTVCTFDDPKDGLAPAASPPPNPCTPAAAAVLGAPTEINPDDFRRLKLVLQWSDRQGTHRMTQTALIVNPSGGLGPRIIDLPERTAQFGPGDGDKVSWAAATNPVTTTPADALTWTASDGLSQGALSGSGAVAWAFDWDLGTLGTPPFVYDGSYLVSAQAFDARGVPGETRSVSVHVNRRVAYAPASLTGGRNVRHGGVVDLDWLRNKERDVVGYQVWRVSLLTAIRVPICNDSGLTYTVKTSCTDTNPNAVNLPSVDYEVAAVDYTDLKAGTGLRPGTRAPLNLATTSTRPDAPVLDVPTIVDGAPQMTWSAPSVGSGQRPIRLYRIYRDGGTSLANRYDVTVDDNRTWTDANAGPSTAHRYWVTAVDTSNNESNPSNAVDSP